MARIISGVLLLVGSGLLAYYAWVMYVGGVPGAPPVQDRPEIPGAIAAALPSPVSAQLKVVYGFGLESGATYDFIGDKPYQEIGLIVAAESVPEVAEFTVEIRLLNGAVYEQFATEVSPADAKIGDVKVIADGEQAQRFLLKVRTAVLGNQGLTFRVIGLTRVPAVMSENARYDFKAPVIDSPAWCDGYEGDQDPSAVRYYDIRCSGVTPQEWSVHLNIDAIPSTRFDNIFPTPTLQGRAGVRWTGAAASSNSASFVDIIAEARGQRLLFLSGVMIGLATAALPFGVQFIWQGIRRRRS